MRTAVIVLNGTLRPETNSDGIDRTLRPLYEALKEQMKVVLLDDGSHRDVDHWLNVHGISGYARAYTPPADFAPRTVAEGRLQMLGTIRNRDGCDLVIESDPICAREELRAGYTVMLYSKPQYLMDIWHPEAKREPRPWDEIVDDIERQRATKARDHRLKQEED